MILPIVTIVLDCDFEMGILGVFTDLIVYAQLDSLHGFARFPEFWLPQDGAFL